jgi:repressor of nif and glnA expression
MPGREQEAEQKLLSILKVLSESSEPVGSITIARELERHGIFLSERAVRYHLRIADERGYTQSLGRGGRMLTPLGMEELKTALAPEQVGFIVDKLELLAFNTTFNPETRTGKVPVNTSLFSQDQFKNAISAMSDTYKAGFCVSELVAVAYEGEAIGSVIVPRGKVGFATVCSVLVNGVMLKAGVPVDSRFGGVLEIKDSSPRRFSAVINYSGTSLDPSEQYIRARMTSVREAARTGNGKILANFREIPAPSRAVVERLGAALTEAGFKGILVLGNTSEPVCRIPVGLDRVGMVLMGGLNPVAAAFEAGVEVESYAESGLVDYQQLTSFWKLTA